MLLQIFLLFSCFVINGMELSNSLYLSSPKVIKLEIITHLIRSNTLNDAIKDIRSLSVVNKSSFQFFNELSSFDKVASCLSQTFNINKPFIVKLLKMPASRLWSTSFYKTIPFDIDKQFVQAVVNNHLKEAFVTLDQGANINTDIQGNPTLIFATTQQNQDLVGFLLKNGSQVNIQNELGETALMHTDNVSIINLLIGYKVDKTIKAKNGYTALDYAMLRYP